MCQINIRIRIRIRICISILCRNANKKFKLNLLTLRPDINIYKRPIFSPKYTMIDTHRRCNGGQTRIDKYTTRIATTADLHTIGAKTYSAADKMEMLK